MPEDISARSQSLLESLEAFFGNATHYEKMLPILTGTSRISLRVLDYFVTSFAPRHKVEYYVNGKRFNVHRSYKKQLEAFSKKQFDPFARKKRKHGKGEIVDETVHFKGPDGHTLATTTAQLQFFRWAIQNCVLDWVIDHLDKIVEDHLETAKLKKKRREARRQAKASEKASKTATAKSSSTGRVTKSTTKTKPGIVQKPKPKRVIAPPKGSRLIPIAGTTRMRFVMNFD